MTYEEICDILRSAGITQARHEAAQLLEKLCSVAISDMPLIGGRDFDCPALVAAVRRRATRYPLQYILGQWGFCNENYYVSPDCLIPRSDTELLVETAAECIPAGGSFLDAGTGSGCIAISLLAARRDIVGCAFDISPRALGVAQKNAEHNMVEKRLKLLRGDMLDVNFWGSVGRFDALISNPPYIRSCEIEELEPELGFEPPGALDGGGDGLDFYRSIIKNAGCALRQGGIIALEIGCTQGAAVAELAAGAGYISEVRHDISGHERVIILRTSRGE